jgi:hypothetical protein
MAEAARFADLHQTVQTQPRKTNADQPCFLGLALFLFMFCILANHHNFSMSFDDFAFFTNRFYRRPYFHVHCLLIHMPCPFFGPLQIFIISQQISSGKMILLAYFSLFPAR